MLKNRQALLFIGDIAMLVTAFVIMVVIRYDIGIDIQLIKAQINFFSLLFLVWLIIFFIFDLYNIRRVNPNPRNIGLIISALLVNVGLSVLVFYLFSPKGISPKTNLAIIVISTFILMVTWRRAFYKMFSNYLTRSIGILGNNIHLIQLKEELEETKYLGKVVYHWQNENEAIEPVDILITEDIHPRKLILLSRKLGAEILSLDNAYQTLFGKISVELMNDKIALDIISRQENKGLAFLYRLVETIFALIVLIVTSPIILISVILIYFENGSPIFYKQKRVGKNGKVFEIYKLRSMYKNAEKDGIKWASKNDDRVTRVGRVLRKLHIDEIPQMINIIRGDIALVGPRPERPEIVADLEKEIPYYYLRHTVKPGFTGWAQIKFRYARTVDDSKEKLQYDLYYIYNRNLMLDIGIILKTVQIIFTH